MWKLVSLVAADSEAGALMWCLLPPRTALPYQIAERSITSRNISVFPILTTLSLQTRQTPAASARAVSAAPKNYFVVDQSTSKQ